MGVQGGRHCLGDTAVILGASHLVAKAIHLLGVEGVNLETALDQPRGSLA
jgi:hypothetical protein